MKLFKRLKKPDPQKEQELREQIEAEGGLEKNDFLAMCLAGAITFLPIAAITLAILVLFILLFL